MPTSVIDIPVNSGEFEAFVAIFNKYQEALKEQPGLWGTVGDAAGEVAAGYAAMTAALLAQNELFRKQDQEREEQSKQEQRLADQKKKLDQEQEKRDKDAARRRRQAIEDTQRIVKSIGEGVVGLAKWTALGGAAGLVTGALGFWGLDRFVAGVGQERRLSQGLGVTTGERQALNLEMGPYVDVNSALENVATAQQDPSKRWLFSSFGVNPNGKDPAQLLVEMASAAGRIFAQSGNNLLYAQARGLTDIFDPDTLRRLAKDLAEVGDAGRAAMALWGPKGALHLSDDVNRKWQQFIVRLDETGLSLKNKLIDRLTDLADPLKDVVTAFGDLADKVLTKVNVEALASALEVFANYIESSAFQRDFKTVVDDISYAASKLVGAMQFLHWLPDPSQPTGNPAAGGSAPPGVSSTTAVAPPAATSPWGLSPGRFGPGIEYNLLPGGAPDPKTGAGKSFMGLSKWGINAETFIGQNLMRWGWSKAQAAGVIANLKAEGTYKGVSFNPFAVGDRGHAYGIAQWHPDRQAAYAKLFGHTMQSVRDPVEALKEQLEFVEYELTKGSRKNAGDALRKDTTAFQAGYDTSMLYEGPRAGRTAAVARGAAAEITIVFLNQTGASPAISVNQMAH